METIEKFSEQQEKAIGLLKRLQEFLRFGQKELQANIDEAMIKKIESTIKDIGNDKLKIALVGGFSEGKTTIAAGWLDKLDKSTMKISESESSDEVAIYDIKDEPLRLIDTPGLFGFKEKNTSSGAAEKYKDITRKYVSEAHIVLYVMNSKNPIKESHTEELKWLFRDLNLLPRTVFVLSRFDEVADVDDENEYKKNFETKKKNITQRLHEILNLTSDEENNLSIVAVSANPFNMDIEKWFTQKDEYKKLSHIENLKTATTEIITKNGNLPAIVQEAQKSVIADVIVKQLPIIYEINKKANKEMEVLENSQKRYSQDIEKSKSEIQEAKTNLQEFFTSYFSNLIRQVRGSSPETFQDFIITEIGNEGCIIESRIQQQINSYCAGVNLKIEQTQNSIETEINHYNSAVGELVKTGIKNTIGKINITNATVKTVRDFSFPFLKFKPWQAVKIAGGIMKALPLIGIAMDVFELWKDAKEKDKFNALVNDTANNLSEQQSQWLQLITSDDFTKNFFPNYTTLIAQTKEIDEKIAERKAYNEKFSKWFEEGKQIKNDFELLQRE